MEALILAGGRGRRLGALTSHTPKPLLPVRGVPFLLRLLQYLKAQAIAEVTISLGYKAQRVMDYFQAQDTESIPSLRFCLESEPLGTGGAIKKALDLMRGPNIFILNGDSFCRVDLSKMLNFFSDQRCNILIAAQHLQNTSRYGQIQFTENFDVQGFKEKSMSDSGFINTGVYLANKLELEASLAEFGSKAFSFEREVLANASDRGLSLSAFPYASEFLDIGVGKDYKLAQKILFLD